MKLGQNSFQVDLSSENASVSRKVKNSFDYLFKILFKINILFIQDVYVNFSRHLGKYRIIGPIVAAKCQKCVVLLLHLLGIIMLCLLNYANRMKKIPRPE